MEEDGMKVVAVKWRIARRMRIARRRRIARRWNARVASVVLFWYNSVGAGDCILCLAPGSQDDTDEFQRRKSDMSSLLGTAIWLGAKLIGGVVSVIANGAGVIGSVGT